MSHVSSSTIRRAARSALLLGLLGALLAGAAPAAAQDGRRTLTGTLDGAPYRIEVPARWNGTLVLYSHGYLPPGFPPVGIALTNRPPDRSESERRLLERGYALAASQFQGDGTGWQVDTGQRDTLALLEWFEEHVGRPRRTVLAGQSLGASIALRLAERHPERFAGVATVCGQHDSLAAMNAALDVNLAVKVLLAPGEDIELVRARDPLASAQALAAAVERGLTTPQGRARLALAGALNDVVGWYTAHAPRPVDPVERIRQQAQWIQYAYSLGFGPVVRADVERRAGGSAVGTVGVDYRRQLLRSSQTAFVREAYRAAGLDLRADLARLEAEPEIVPDREARRWALRFGVPRGSARVPVVTLHTTGDGGAVPNQERWYAGRVRRHGDPAELRQLWIERGMHCSFSAAEELVALRMLLERVETGRWPATDPARLNAAARALGPGLDLVLDFGTGQDAPMAPAFARFLPPRLLRPSR